MLGIKCLPRSGDLYEWYKPKMRVNVAEGAYVAILNWQAEGSAVKGAAVGYVSNR